MRSDSVFSFSGGRITPLPARDFRAGLFGKTLEDALQTLIEKEPNLLSGRQLEPGSDDPPRFALLRREMPVGDWSVDHLLVDQHGVLTLVEAKLVQNRESRRDVIGQVIEYAANAQISWGDGRLRQFCSDYWKGGENLEKELRRVFGEIDIERLWSDINENLRQSRLRLVIAADELRPEVRRVIEFLNGQLKSIQLLGLEVRCYGADAETGVIASFVVGETQAVADKGKTAAPARIWNEDELRSFYLSEPDRYRRRTQLLDWALKRGCAVLGKQTQSPLFSLRGRAGTLIATVYPNLPPYVFLKAAAYSTAEERDSLVRDLKGLSLYPKDLDALTVADGRSLVRDLDDLTEHEFENLLAVLARYCGAAEGVESTSSAAFNEP